jgi:hypothetical protein
MKLVSTVTDIFIAPLFRTDDQGRRVFVPSAMSSDRFLLPDAQTEQRLRTRMATLVAVSLVISLLLIAGAVAVFGPARMWTAGVWLGLTAAFAVHMAINIRIGKGLAKGLDRSAAKPVGFLRGMAEQAAVMPRWLCWLEVIVAPLVLVGGIIGVRDGVTTYDLTMSFVAIPLSGLMLAVGLAGLLGRK